MPQSKTKKPYPFGRRERPDDGPWMVYTLTEDCVVIFRELGPPSLGGAWQFIAAGRRPGDAAK